MARPLRIERPGAWYHVTSRGNERRAIYREDRDRLRFLECLGEMSARFGLVVHAYVLMDNHYHLLLEIRSANLSRAMQWLNVSYSLWFNRRHTRVGHLFQGRFKAVIVDPQGWGLALSRYIHLNPVRTQKLGLDKRQQQRVRAGAAGPPDPLLVQERLMELKSYPWSSFRCYAGLARGPEWLECGAVLRLGGDPKAEHRRKYRAYVEAAIREGLTESPWQALQEQVVLGGPEFLAGLRAHVAGDSREQRGAARLRDPRPTLEEVVRRVEEVRGRAWEEFRDVHGDDGRDMVLHLGRTVSGSALGELAALAGMKQYATVAMAVRRFEGRLSREPALKREHDRVRQMLNVKM